MRLAEGGREGGSTRAVWTRNGNIYRVTSFLADFRLLWPAGGSWAPLGRDSSPQLTAWSQTCDDFQACCWGSQGLAGCRVPGAELDGSGGLPSSPAPCSSLQQGSSCSPLLLCTSQARCCSEPWGCSTAEPLLCLMQSCVSAQGKGDLWALLCSPSVLFLTPLCSFPEASISAGGSFLSQRTKRNEGKIRWK